MNPEQIKSITLTCAEIRDLAEAAGFVISPVSENDDMEIEFTIIEHEGGVTILDDDDTPRKYPHGAYIEDYPEEGTYPLGEEIK